MFSHRTGRKVVGRTLMAAYLLCPFISFNAKPLIGFDLQKQQLHFFGSTLWMQDFFLVALGVIGFVLLFLAVTLTFGRLWCGWTCPQTLICDLVDPLYRHLRSKDKTAQTIAHLLFFTLGVAFAMASVAYFIRPNDIFSGLASGQSHPFMTGSLVLITLATYINLVFIGRDFCIKTCPFSRLQSLFTDKKSMTIAMVQGQESDCIDCKQCVRICPVGIDIRQGYQIACIACGLCIDRCREMMAGVKKKGVIKYQMDTQSVTLKKLLRIDGLGLFFLSFILFSVIGQQLWAKAPFDFTMLPNGIEPKLTPQGGVSNGYILSVRNKSDHTLKLDLVWPPANKADDFNHSLVEPIKVPAGMVKKVMVFVRSQEKNDSGVKLKVALQDHANHTRQVQQTIYFPKP